MRNNSRKPKNSQAAEARKPSARKSFDARIPRQAPRRRAHGVESHPSFVPPEDWYEPTDDTTPEFKVVRQNAGSGLIHPIGEKAIRDRLSELPEEMLYDLEAVQLSRLTRKKRTFPCYGMQWGPAIYLYPVEASLEEFFSRPPTPRELNETKMYGGRWRQRDTGWTLSWTEQTISDFYLNNVLIHELGHLLDSRNSGYHDRERFAEWFAIEHGYRPTQPQRRAKAKKVKKRHHGQ